MARSTDKAIGQSMIEAPLDIFEQFLTFDTSDAEGSSSLPKSESTLLAKPLGKPDPNEGHSKFWESDAGQDFGLEAQMHYNSALCPEPIGYNSLAERASNSAQALLSLKSITLHSPDDFSPPSSPKASAAESLRGRRRNPKRPSIINQKERAHSHHRKSSPIRKATCPPKMMHISTYSESIQDLGQRLALSKFDFGFQDTSIPLSPPPSARISDSSDHNNNMMSTAQQQNQGIAWDRQLPQNFTYKTPGETDSPLITPPADVMSFHQSNFHQPYHSETVFTSPRTQFSSWLDHENSSTPFDSPTAYVTTEEPTPLLWSHASAIPLAQPFPSAYHRHSHNNRSLAMELQAELAFNADELAMGSSNLPSGLMIQMPHSTGQKSCIINSSPSSTQPQHCYAPLTGASPQIPRAHRHTKSQPQSLVQDPDFFPLPKARGEKSHSRTASASPPSPRTRSSSFHVTKQRRSVSKKRGDQAGTVKTPRSATNGHSNAMHDFVNFTPNDRKKILTGVAPSGSSKTKARREKEAIEKSRRLSQAAVRAVRAAGGSIKGLVEEGLYEAPTGNYLCG